MNPADFPFRDSRVTTTGAMDLNALFDHVDDEIRHNPARSDDLELSAQRFDRLTKKVRWFAVGRAGDCGVCAVSMTIWCLRV